MSLLKILNEKLTPEQLQEIQDALGDDFNYDVVPRSRLNAVIKQRNSLKEQLAGQSQGPDDDDDDDDDGSIIKSSEGGTGAGTQKSEKTLTQKAVNKLLADKDREKEEALAAQRLEFATREKLRESNALDVDIVFNLLDKTKITFGDDGKLNGLEDQVKALQEGKSFLFGKEDNSTPGERGTGRRGDGGSNNLTGVDAQLDSIFSNYGVSVIDE